MSVLKLTMTDDLAPFCSGSDEWSFIDQEKLLFALLPEKWQWSCEIDNHYIPPHPSKRTSPTVAVHFIREDGTKLGLRYSKGPGLGVFWDVYSDDWQTPELAIIALSKAPCPLSYPHRGNN